MRPDLAVHQRLGESRLVALVVAEAAIAEHVDHDGLLELLAIFGRDLGGEHDRFRDRRRCTWKIGASTILATSDG